MRPKVVKAVKIAAVILCVAALGTGAAVLIHHRKTALARAPRYGITPIPVRVGTARRGSLTVTRDYLAIAEPAQTANLSARLTSRIESVSVDEGQLVHAHSPLIRLDSQEIVNNIEAADAHVAQVRAELAANDATVEALKKSAAFWAREADRMKALLPRGAATQSEAEAAIEKADHFAGQLKAAERKGQATKHQITALDRRVDELRTRLGYCTISSPFDGIAAQRNVDPGDQATPGKTLLVVEDRSRMKLAFDIPQQDVADFRTGMLVRLRGPEGRLTTTVEDIFPTLNQSRMLRVEAILEPPRGSGLDCGAYVPVTVVLETHDDITLVPASAIVQSPAGQAHVFALTDGELRPLPVTVLGRHEDEAGVEGIDPGTEVVLSTFLGWSRLSAGLRAEAVP